MQVSYASPVSSLITPPPPRAADVDMETVTRPDKKPRLEDPQSSVGWITMDGLILMISKECARHVENKRDKNVQQVLIADDMVDFHFKIQPGLYRAVGDIKISLHSDATSSSGP